MYAKLKDGKIEQFPYTIGQFRKDHSNVSFPKNITSGILESYGVVGVVESPKPECGPYQMAQLNSMPHRPVIGQHTEEDAPSPDMVGKDILASYWTLGYTVVDMFSDDDEGTKAEKEAAYQAGLDAEAAKGIRAERNRLLSESDWTQVIDAPVDQTAWAEYRQALRDITSQEGFPHNVVWPVEP